MKLGSKSQNPLAFACISTANFEPCMYNSHYDGLITVRCVQYGELYARGRFSCDLRLLYWNKLNLEDKSRGSKAHNGMKII